MEQGENQILIQRQNQPLSYYALVYDSLEEYFFKLISVTGAVQGIASTYGIILNCNRPNNTKCISIENRNSFYIALGAAFLEWILKSIKLGLNNSHSGYIAIFDKIADILIGLIGTHNFYLLCGAAIATAAAHSPNIENWKFGVGVALPTIALAFFTNAEIRYKVRKFCCRYSSKEDRGFLLKILDSFSNLLEGGALMIGSISAIAQIHDTIHKISPDSSDSWTYSTTGMAVRYSMGGAYGIFQSLLRWHYSPIIKEDQILQNRWPSVVQSIFTFFTFMILTGFAISQNETPDIALMTVLWLLLSAAGLIHVGINVMRNYSHVSEQNLPALFIEDSDNREPASNSDSDLTLVSSAEERQPTDTTPYTTAQPETHSGNVQVGNIARKFTTLFNSEPDEKINQKELKTHEYAFNVSLTEGLSTPGI